MSNMKKFQQLLMPSTSNRQNVVIVSGVVLTVVLALGFAIQLRGVRGATGVRSAASMNPIPAPLNGATASVVRVVSPTFVAGQNGTVIIELDSQGNENAVGLSLSFNPSQLTFVSAVKGSDATNATLNKNSNSAGSGQVGIVIAQSSDQTFAAGTRQLVVVTFAAAASGSLVVSSGDQPVLREVADVNANPLAATFTP